MIIQASNISMQSSHLRASVQQHQTSLTLWQEAPANRAQSEQPRSLTPKAIAQQALAMQPKHQDSAAPEIADKESKLSPELLKMKQAIESLMAWMLGRTVSIQLFSEKDLHAQPADDSVASLKATPDKAEQLATDASPNWGLIYHESHQYAEMESLSVGMQGAVTTADGRSINFDLSLAMARNYYSESHFEMRAGAALKDPLIINFGGQPAQLSLHKIEFDLIQEEAGMESITQLNAGSGYLAFDRNNNGIIDDGSELFGPNSGNGFAELAQLDEDGNGWIDEGDKVFSQLQIWQPNSDGSQNLVAIAKLGIGAIYTRGIEAPFDYKTNDNQLQGQLKQAGIFLFEDGRAGSVQQVDLVA